MRREDEDIFIKLILVLSVVSIILTIEVIWQSVRLHENEKDIKDLISNSSSTDINYEEHKTESEVSDVISENISDDSTSELA